MKTENKRLAIGLCTFLLLISTAAAIRTEGTVAEASSVSRLVGDSPYDIINQLDTKQINLNHATHLANRLDLLEDTTNSRMIVEGFQEYNIKGDASTYHEGGLLPWDGYGSISQDLSLFQPNELFVLESYIDANNQGIYANRFSRSDIIYPQDVRSWKSTFAETNPLFLLNIEGAGLALPDQPNYINPLTRYSTIIAPKDVRSSELAEAILCNLHDNQKIGDVYRRARSKYYATTDPSDQNMPGLVLKSYALYGNPLTRVEVPDDYEEYIKEELQWYNPDNWFNPCRNYYVPPEEYLYDISVQSVGSPAFENQLRFGYDVIALPNSAFRIINSTDLEYDYNNPNAVGLYTIRTHRLPKGSFIKDITASFANPVNLTIPDYPSFDNGEYTGRNCYDLSQEAQITKEVYEKENYDEIAVYISPLEINNCAKGEFTLYQDALYDIGYIPASPFYFDSLVYGEVAAPGKEVTINAVLSYVSNDVVNGTIVLVQGNETIYSKEITSRPNNYTITFYTGEEEGISGYELQYIKEGDVRTRAKFDMETRIVDGSLVVGDFDGGSAAVALDLSNHAGEDLPATIKAELVKGGFTEIFNQDRILMPGRNEITFTVDGLKKEDISYGIKAYVIYENRQKVFSDIIMTNHEPVIKAEDVFVRVGELFDLNIEVFDPDGDATTVTIAPIGFASQKVATEQDVGQHIINIEATDAFSTAARAITLHVLPENYEPVLGGIGAITAEEGETVLLILYADDPDNDNITYVVDDPNFTQIDDNWFEWQTAMGDAGEYEVRYSVSDGTATMTKTALITVLEYQPRDSDNDGYNETVDCNDLNPAIHPDATEICNVIDDDCNDEVDEGLICEEDADNDGFNSVIDCNDTDADINPDAAETCNQADDNCNDEVDENGVCANMIQVTIAGSTILVAQDQADHTLEFGLILQQALDACTTNDCEIPITISSPASAEITLSDLSILYEERENRPPILEQIESISVSEGEVVTITAHATDPDNDTLSYSINDSRFAQENGIFTWQTTFEDAGQYSVSVMVSDGEYISSQEVAVIVNDQDQISIVSPVSGATYNTLSVPLEWMYAGAHDIEWAAYSLDGGENATNLAVPQVILYEDYEEGTPGELVPGWSKEFYYSGQDAYAGSQSGVVSYDFDVFRDFPEVAKGIVEIDVWHRPQLDDTNSMFAIGSDNHADNIWHTNERRRWHYHPQGIYYADYDGSWTHFLARINTQTSQYTLWMNGNLVIADNQLGANYSDGIQYLDTHSGRGGQGKPSYFDNLKVSVLKPANITLTDLAEGDHNLTVYTRDVAGNSGQSAAVHFTVDTCTTSWQCNGWAACHPDNTGPCNSAVDINNCFAETGSETDAYTGDYTEFNPVECDYLLLHAPVLDTIPDITADEGDLVTITANAADPNNDSVSYAIDDSRFTQDGPTFTWQTGYDEAGQYTVTVTVSDGEHTASQEVAITVNNLDPITILSPINGTTYNSSAIDLHWVYQGSNDLEWVAYSLDNDEQMSIAAPHVILFEDYEDGAPGALVPGWDKEFYYSDQDAYAGSQSGVISYDLDAYMELPEVAKGIVDIDLWERPQLYNTNSMFAISTGTRVDNIWHTNEQKKWHYHPQGIAYADYDGSWTHFLARIDTDTSKYTLWMNGNLVVADNQLGADYSEGIQRLNAHSGRGTSGHPTYYDNLRIAVLEPTALTNLSEGSHNITIYGEDTAGSMQSEHVYFTVDTCTPSWQCNGWAACQPGNTRSCNSVIDANNCQEQYTAGYTEFDPKECDYRLLHAPVLNTVPNILVHEGDAVTITANATDPDGDAITYSVNDSRFTQDANIFTWQTSFDDAGVYTVTVAAKDSTLMDTQEVQVTVLDKNQPPLLQPLGQIEAGIGDTIIIIPFASDPDGDQLTYQYSGWMTASVYTTKPGDEGTHTVTVTVSDGEFSVSGNTTIIVHAEPDADNDGVPDSLDKVAGNIGNIDTNIPGIQLLIGDSADLDQELTGTAQVQIRDDGAPIVEFTADFSAMSLDLSNLMIARQEPDAERGSLIVSGISLPAGQTKTLYIDRVGGKDAVCVKDMDVSSITEVSESCAGSNERIIPCDSATRDGYSCTAAEDKLRVTGLRHSAVIETDDPCAGVTCTDYCSENRRRSGGSCVSGQCVYQEEACAFGCENNACKADPCAGVSCQAYCSGGTSFTNGVCSQGVCAYQSQYCQYGCKDAICQPNLCEGVTCGSYCRDSTLFSNGRCLQGICIYNTQACQAGCEQAACIADPCAGITCNPYCDGTTRYSGGACVGGKCAYQAEMCSFGCENNVCKADPCAGITCSDYCEGSVQYSGGACSAGQCSYQAQSCPFGCQGNTCIANAAPVIASTPPALAKEGIAYQYTVSASDADHDALTFSDNSLLFDIGIDGAISFTPTQADAGSHDITITVRDRFTSATQQFRLEIRRNEPPTARIITAPQTITAGGTILLAGSGEDPEDDITAYRWDLSSYDARQQNVIFVSANTYAPGSFGGLAGADAKCQQEANAAGLLGTFKAFLSANDLPYPTDRCQSALVVQNRLTTAQYYQVDGTPAGSVNLDANGNRVTGKAVTYTRGGCAENQDRVEGSCYGSHDCNGWTDPDTRIWNSPSCCANGCPPAQVDAIMVGQAPGQQASTWVACNEQVHLYCAQQDTIQGGMVMQQEYPATLTRPGTYVFTLKVQDDLGMWSSPQSIQITIEQAEPAELAAPAEVHAVDKPNDRGGYVNVHFSPVAGAEEYWIYAGITRDFAGAEKIKTVPASSFTGAVSVPGPSPAASRNYWVQAASSNRQSVLAGPNLAVPIDNSRREDLSGNGVVDVLDLAIIAQVFANTAEYDPAIDLNNDGQISILDIAAVAAVFGQEIHAYSFDNGQLRYTLKPIAQCLQCPYDGAACGQFQICAPSCPVPPSEVCDGADNDCDGKIDNITRTINCGVGACARTVTQSCAAGTWIGDCTPGEPQAETVNAVDDDCNGVVDDVPSVRYAQFQNWNGNAVMTTSTWDSAKCDAGACIYNYRCYPKGSAYPEKGGNRDTGACISGKCDTVCSQGSWVMCRSNIDYLKTKERIEGKACVYGGIWAERIPCDATYGSVC